MSIRTEQYFILGKRFNFITAWPPGFNRDDFFEPNSEGMFVLHDGLCANYTILGRLLKKAQSFDEPVELAYHEADFIAEAEKTERWINETLLRIGLQEQIHRLDLIVVTHYS